MTMKPPESLRSAGPSGIRADGVHLCVALFSILVVASVLFMPLLSFMPATHDHVVEVDVQMASLDVQDQRSSDCCPLMHCSDSQGCSMPCASSCPVPVIALFDKLLYEEMSSGAGIPSAVADDRLVQPTASALFRPPVA